MCRFVVYTIQCEDCEGDYFGETGRAFETRLKEQNATSGATLMAIGEHLKNSGHSLNMSSTTIIKMQCQGPTLNRDSGYELPAVFLDILPRDSQHLKSRDIN